jgi:hypothetical protein
VHQLHRGTPLSEHFSLCLSSMDGMPSNWTVSRPFLKRLQKPNCKSAGISLEGGIDQLTHVMKILCNVCGSKQAGCTFNTHLASKLVRIRFKQSTVNLRVFCKGKMMHVLHTHDSILEGPDLNKRVKLDIAVEGGTSPIS